MPEERERKIQEALQAHRDKVKEKYRVVMTALCGSQNYGLDTEKSDYDTYTFVLPELKDIAMLKDPVSTLIEDEYGHINIKDIRMALNLLKKTTPNSVEWFATKYRIIEPEYADLFERHITPETLRCNTKHMMDAIAGMAHQLTRRNMPPGKRYSHLIRMECMVENYYDMCWDILSMPVRQRERARKVKRLSSMDVWDGKCFEIEKVIKEKIKSYSVESMVQIENIGNDNVDQLQAKLMNRYLRSELKMPVMSCCFSPEREVWNNA